MKVFVTGAAGFIGKPLTQTLRARGHAVVGLARDNAAAERLRGLGVEPRLGDLNDAELMTREARASEGVIHLALQLGPDVGVVDRTAIDALLAGLARSGKPYVGASAAGLVGDTGATVVNETRPLPVGGPNAWRVDNEARVLSAAALDGVRAMAVRPAPMVFGRGGGQLIPKLLEDARTTGSARYVGAGAQAWSTAYVDDVAALFADVLERGTAGEAYFAASDETTAWLQIAEAIANAAGKQGRTASFTTDEAIKVVGFLGGLMGLDIRVSNAKARALGWKARGAKILDEIANYSQTMGNPI